MSSLSSSVRTTSQQFCSVCLMDILGMSHDRLASCLSSNCDLSSKLVSNMMSSACSWACCVLSMMLKSYPLYCYLPLFTLNCFWLFLVAWILTRFSNISCSVRVASVIFANLSFFYLCQVIVEKYTIIKITYYCPLSFHLFSRVLCPCFLHRNLSKAC